MKYDFERYFCYFSSGSISFRCACVVCLEAYNVISDLLINTHKSESYLGWYLFLSLDINECASNPCVNGDCIDEPNMYNCTCQPGWTGVNCHIGKEEYSLQLQKRRYFQCVITRTNQVLYTKKNCAWPVIQSKQCLHSSFFVSLWHACVIYYQFRMPCMSC